MHGGGDGLEAEIRADAALAFGKEHQDYLRHQERIAKAAEAGPGAPAPGLYRRRRGKDPVLANGFTVCGRSLLANSDGHVRLELIMSGEAASDGNVDEQLDSILTTAVHVVREGSTELISAGFPVARLYLEQSAKTADPHSEAVTVQLLREGQGSPFLIVLHPDSGEGRRGTELPDKPAMFDAVTCRLVELAGRTTGVWEIWGAGAMRDWLVPVRMLCRIICQLSEVATLTALQQDPNALAPHLLDEMLTDRFYRTRAGQLRRPKQGDWPVQAVQPFAAQHLNVALDENLHSRENLAGFLRRDVAADVGKSMDRIRSDMTDHKMLRHSDRMRLVELLARQALSEENYFSSLMKRASLPPAFRLQKQTKWTGDIETDAMDLIDWALAKGTNPAEPQQMTLTSLLLPELPRLGLEDAATIVAIVSRYGLLRDGAQLSDLQIRYQCPVTPPADEPAQPVGPDIDWQGPDDLQLQSWLAPEPPDYLDVGYLIEAIRSAASVCLIEVPATGKTGTGVLVDSRHVLTNYHVVQEVIGTSGPTVDAGSIRLTFGSFSQDAKCHVIGVDAAAPIVASSPVVALDYALLRLSAGIEALPRLKPAPFAAAPPPLKAALSILQHPHGGTMKLAPSHNAITFINAEKGLVQYATRTSSGSSGAPCFNDKWEVVAIHHAERTRPFGSIREGILIGAIRKEIQKFLT